MTHSRLYLLFAQGDQPGVGHGGAAADNLRRSQRNKYPGESHQIFQYLFDSLCKSDRRYISTVSFRVFFSAVLRA